jgi:hypothetical protein
VSSHAPDQANGQAPKEARVIELRPSQGARPAELRPVRGARPAEPAPPPQREQQREPQREPLWRDLVGDVLRRERLAQERTLKDVADEARISMPYLSEVERGRKEASSEVLAAAAHALGLGLGDLLLRAQGELVRITSRQIPRGRTTAPSSTPSSYNGLCLAA